MPISITNTPTMFAKTTISKMRSIRRKYSRKANKFNLNAKWLMHPNHFHYMLFLRLRWNYRKHVTIVLCTWLNFWRNQKLNAGNSVKTRFKKKYPFLELINFCDLCRWFYFWFKVYLFYFLHKMNRRKRDYIERLLWNGENGVKLCFINEENY